MKKGIEYGYVRVSSMEQNVSRQITAMLNAGIRKENIYVDKQTGKDFHRQNYEKMLSLLQRPQLCGSAGAVENTDKGNRR